MIIEVPDLTGSEAGDIAITAAEGGINYWAQIVRYHPIRDDGEGWVDPDTNESIDVHDEYVFYTIEFENPKDDEPYGRLRFDITPALLRRGVEIALKDKPLRSDLLEQLSDRETWDEMDSELADCIVQLGVFGEVVFG